MYKQSHIKELVGVVSILQRFMHLHGYPDDLIELEFYQRMRELYYSSHRLVHDMQEYVDRNTNKQLTLL